MGLSKSKLRKTNGKDPVMDDVDLTLLRRLVSGGTPLRPDELAHDDGLEITAAEAQSRMTALADAGYVNLNFTATVRGGSHVYRHVHHQRDLRAA